MRLLKVTTLLVALIGVGCGPDYEPYPRLSKLRVLAVGAEPASPGPGETATLSALVFTPPGAPVPTYTWSWCPFPGPAAEGYPCMVTEDDLVMLGPAGMTVPKFDLGTNPTAVFPHTIEPALLAAVCMGVPGAPVVPRCTYGFRAQVKVTVRSGDESVTAVQDLWLRFAPEQMPNANPKFGAGGIVVRRDGTDVPLSDMVTLPRDQATVVKVDVAESEAEMFLGKSQESEGSTELVPMRERLSLSWFVEGSNLKNERTGYIENFVSIADATKNEWTPLPTKDDERPEAERGTARLFVVLADSRGGVSWTSGMARLSESP